jgi:molybdopterin molybdotransferase
MISYREAKDILLKRARSFGSETIPLAQAFGRVLDGAVAADRDYPPFDRATMDGYALRAADLRGDVRRFSIIGTVFAGDIVSRALCAGEAYKIMTGAPVPPGADMVVRKEDTREDEAVVHVQAGVVRPWLNIARKGEDISSGSIVIDGPCIAEPAVIGLLASLGQKNVTVARLPKIALITTGNEVVAVGTQPGPAQIRNSNRWLLQAFLKKWLIEPSSYKHVPDDRTLLKTSIGEALSADIIILSGGVSAGDADHVPEMLEAAGVACLFHKLAIKPGKPVWCGASPGGRLVFALPGNPFSCLVGFVLLIQPYLRACFGLPEQMLLGLPMGRSKKKHTTLDEFFPVCLQGSPAKLQPISLNGSGDIRLGMQANALALHPAADPDLEEGETVTYFPL